VQEEHREHSTLLRAAERERCPIRGDLQRAEDVEFELLRDSERSALGTSVQAHIALGEVRAGPGRPAPHVARCPAGEHEKWKTRKIAGLPFG
jgi:hypothetical protein